MAARNASLRPGQNQLTIAQFFDHHATEADTSVMVLEEDFHAAHMELVPSVSADEFAHYEKVRQAFEGKDEKKTTEAKPAQPAALKMRVPPSNYNVPAGDHRSPSRTPSLPIGRKPVATNGNGSRPSRPVTQLRDGSSFYLDQNETSVEDLDEYVVRTDHLKRSVSRATTVTNGGHDNGHESGDDVEFLRQFGQPQARENIRSSIGSLRDTKGKSKRGASYGNGFGSATNGDEDLYR